MTNMISVRPGQMAAAGRYIEREWGGTGYRIEGIETRTHAVTVFRVVASDGSRFTVLADRWENCAYLDTHNGDGSLSELVAAMHAKAVAS